MPIYVERAGADYLTGAELIEQLSSFLAGQYQTVETRLLAEIARRVARDLDATDATVRLAAIAELRELTRRALADLDAEALARRIVATALNEGTAAAIEQLGIAQAAAGKSVPLRNAAGELLPLATGITPNAVIASGQIALELTNALADVNARILRAVPDLYQQTTARFVGDRLLGGITGKASRAAQVVDFLSQGVTGFTDVANRRWRVGSYTEMASRTATNRAWIDAHVQQWAGAGLHLVSIVRGVDSCRECAAWGGKVLSTDGTTGTIEAEHAITGEPVTVTIDGTLAQARAGGWNHPNCRCTLAVVFPGLTRPADDTTYDPERGAARDKLRALERRVREYKRRAELAEALGDDVAAAAWRRKVRDAQAAIRDHIAATGQLRKPYREQLSYSDGRAAPAAPKPQAIAR